MKKLSYLLLILFFIACKQEKTSKEIALSSENEIDKTSAVVLNMEGETYTMTQKDLNPQQKLDFVTDKLQYDFYTNESTVSINFNLIETAALQSSPITYTIPDANSSGVNVDLSFFNNDRDVEKRTNKRIVFRKGTITITELTKNTLKMDFKGEGSGMMERDTSFPITGSINIRY